MDIKVPSVGESVYEALIARWLKKSGDHVEKDEPLCEIETDKVTLEVTAEAAGVLNILVPEVETVKIGAVIGTIEEGAQAAAGEGKPAAAEAPKPGTPSKAPQAPPVREPKPETPPVEEPKPETPPVREPQPQAPPVKEPPKEQTMPPISPSGRKLAREMGVDTRELQGSGRGGRITREDLLKGQEAPAAKAPAEPAPRQEPAAAAPVQGSARAVAREPSAGQYQREGGAAPAVSAPLHAEQAERVTRKAMSPIRKRIAERLVAVRQQTAMLTTFNEADMSEVMGLRKKHGEFFQKRHNVKLGLMSLFVRACCQALKEFPEINASIEGDDIVYHNYCDIGIAVGSEKGLVVPVLRDAETLTLAQIEQRIVDFGEKIRTNKLAIADLEGGTFTISNGGIYGSLLSTPILNPPQSGVLGMHAIQERAVVKDGEIVIRPMMNLALSYDHRIVDGKGAVGFLKLVKQFIEEPEEMFLES
ncbi:2-oxoglutarate dehydrogenase complex dihydrolipoyllysine-residue succinyltransferase [Geomonas sp.]|uniref:2-oxoglutarate dehydrogenase complex dihydrolipoyllysine-residue succinyltransferase n=1 Tax=Geomonas sp. TaxID=2651584 RepID=UPI002B47CDA8|nr:2-oxoglutarate dehydrogenase complex dihydrolipoyllysine-residue succinyltransferase [Geomonas sp.]HJV34234.1 2-oxoglutarate dehydrogenase complex dihydrolipoyllysine-residue succinyltransferase [Geomonas sp.]